MDSFLFLLLLITIIICCIKIIQQCSAKSQRRRVLQSQLNIRDNERNGSGDDNDGSGEVEVDLDRILEKSRKDYIIDHLVIKKVEHAMTQAESVRTSSLSEVELPGVLDLGDGLPEKERAEAEIQRIVDLEDGLFEQQDGLSEDQNPEEADIVNAIDQEDCLSEKQSEHEKTLYARYPHWSKENATELKCSGSTSLSLTSNSSNLTDAGLEESVERSERLLSAESACTICLGNYEIGEDVCWSTKPQCSHVFHKVCLEGWLMTHDDCPCCRTNYFDVQA